MMMMIMLIIIIIIIIIIVTEITNLFYGPYYKTMGVSRYHIHRRNQELIQLAHSVFINLIFLAHYRQRKPEEILGLTQ